MPVVGCFFFFPYEEPRNRVNVLMTMGSFGYQGGEISLGKQNIAEAEAVSELFPDQPETTGPTPASLPPRRSLRAAPSPGETRHKSAIHIHTTSNTFPR